MENDLNKFITYLEFEKELKKASIKAYKKDIEEYYENSFNYESFVKNKYRMNSIKRKLSSLNVYFKWLLKIGKINVLPIFNLELEEEEEKKELSIEEFEDFLKIIDKNEKFLLFFHLILKKNLKLSDLINIRKDDIDNNFSYIKLKEKLIFIPEASKLLEKYLSTFKIEEFLFNETFVKSFRLYLKKIEKELKLKNSLNISSLKKAKNVNLQIEAKKKSKELYNNFNIGDR